MTPSQLSAWLDDPARSTRVMGILNVTPDSFSDGGKYQHADAALAHAQKLVADGADWIDVGAESTRPGAQRVGTEEQLRRLAPVLRELRGRVPVVLSIDTTLAPVAEAALDAGFDVINDISAGRDDPAMLGLAARHGVPVILMHMQGSPATMQADPKYQNVVEEVQAFLEERMAAAVAAGSSRGRILIDPGIGFGKTTAHNLALLRELPALARIAPLVLGASRKAFVGKITGESVESGRLFGAAATVAWAAIAGAALVRVHDPQPMSQVVRMMRAIQHGAA